MRWPEFKFIFFVGAAIFLVILVILIFIIINLRGDIREATEKYDDLRSQINNISIDNPDWNSEDLLENLTNRVAELQEIIDERDIEITRLNEQLNAPERPIPPADPQDPPNGSNTNQQEPPSQILHVVQDHENMWIIAARFLGNGARYPEIVAANNLSSSTVSPGMVLIIPQN